MTLSKAYSDNYPTAEKGLLRLVDGKLTFIDIKKNPLTLIEKIKKHFGYGGFNLKEIWHFVDQNIKSTQNIDPSMDLKGSLAKLQAASEKFDKKAIGLFACWRVTKEIRDLALSQLVDTNQIDTKGPQALKAILNEIPDLNTHPDALQTNQDREVALSKGIVLIKKVFDTDQSELNRKSVEECIEIEFEIYERVKKIKNVLKAEMPESNAVRAFHDLVKVTPALKEIKELKRLLKMGDRNALERVSNKLLEERLTREAAGTLCNKFSKELLTMKSGDISNVFRERKVSPENDAKWKKVWGAVCKNIFTVAQEWRPVQLDSSLTSKNITWLTGSSTASLVPIFKKAIDNKPALVPTGELIKHNIVPLTGELARGLAGINKIALSGVDLSHHKGALRYANWAKGYFAYSPADEIKFIQSFIQSKVKDPKELSASWVLQRLKIAAIRLGWAGIEKQDVIGMLKSVLQNTNSPERSNAWEQYSELLKSKIKTSTSASIGNKRLVPGDIVLVSRPQDDKGNSYSLGVVSSASAQDERVSVLVDGGEGEKSVDRKNAYTLSAKDVSAFRQNKSQYAQVSSTNIESIKDQFKSEREKIEEVVALLESTSVFNMTAEEKKLIDTPGAILWGTVTKKDFLPVRSDIPGEKGLKGKQQLGEDIQVLFVEPERMDEVRAYVAQHLPTACKVHVISSSVIPFLHAHQLRHNEHCSL